MNNEKIEVHLSWLLEACNEQLSFIFGDLKRALLVPELYKTPGIKKVIVHLEFTQKLMKVTKDKYHTLIINNIKNQKVFQNLKTIYVKRALFNEQLAAEYLKSMNYDELITNNKIYHELTVKIKNLDNMMSEIYEKL